MSELYWYNREVSTVFMVKNIAPKNKTIKIFNYPILNGQTWNLLTIPGVSEADLRYSLLRGDLYIKFVTNEAFVVDSNIDLLQFNNEQKQFLRKYGVKKGLQVDFTNMDVFKNEDIKLIGTVNDLNTVYYIPNGFFIQDDIYKIVVYKNGVKQVFLDDYFIAESEGLGVGFDTVILVIPPETIPSPDDIITADYYTVNQ